MFQIDRRVHLSISGASMDVDNFSRKVIFTT
jgi:hypothetical protein